MDVAPDVDEREKEKKNDEGSVKDKLLPDVLLLSRLMLTQGRKMCLSCKEPFCS